MRSDAEILNFVGDKFPEDWNAFVNAAKSAKNLDTDFAEEDYDGPVGRLHIAQARLSNIIRSEFPHLIEDRVAVPNIIWRAHRLIAGLESSE